MVIDLDDHARVPDNVADAVFILLPKVDSESAVVLSVRCTDGHYPVVLSACELSAAAVNRRLVLDPIDCDRVFITVFTASICGT